MVNFTHEYLIGKQWISEIEGQVLKYPTMMTDGFYKQMMHRYFARLQELALEDTSDNGLLKYKSLESRFKKLYHNDSVRRANQLWDHLIKRGFVQKDLRPFWITTNQTSTPIEKDILFIIWPKSVPNQFGIYSINTNRFWTSNLHVLTLLFKEIVLLVKARKTNHFNFK